MAAKRVVDGLFVVALGGILLANTSLGLPWTVWISILSLWPVLLVSAGIDIIGGSTRQPWVRVLASVVSLAALLYGALVMPPGTWGAAAEIRGVSQPTIAFSDSAPHVPGVTAGDAVVEVASGNVSLTGGDGLAAISGRAPRGLVPVLQTSAQGGVASVAVRPPSHMTFMDGIGGGGRLAVVLDRAAEWRTLTLDLGAAQADIDLSGITVDNVDANVGASALAITFPADRAVSARVSAGACSIRFRVPRNASVTLVMHGFPVAVTAPDGYRRQGGVIGTGTWTRSGTAGDIRLSVSSGMSSIEIIDY